MVATSSNRPTDGAAAALPADFTKHLEALYPRIKAPAQILWGTEDRWIAPEAAQRPQTLIPGTRLSYLPDAGHFAMLDTPNLVRSE